jgi:hypothetical protein
VSGLGGNGVFHPMTPSVPQSELGILLILWRALSDDLRTFSISAEGFAT